MELAFDLFIIVLRTFGAYIVVFGILRIMGKREIGEIGILDLVIFIMLAEMAVISIESVDKSFLFSITPMVILLIIQRITARVSLNSQKARRWMDGRPAVIIREGKLDEKEMSEQRYNIDDLLIQLHDKGIQLIQEVELAILEPNGRLSVFEKKDNPVKFYEPLILDGKIQHKVLEIMNKDEKWLKKELGKLGYEDNEQISYCSMNKDGSLHVDETNKEK
ncbi:uncharacterized membrane protein YcaP (DUF421 family) [Salirhabdus euzebyi]|uniref:Uncharacterized membrane protein YcaP (DUF421 family) n=1 Tax=Salirhabdus euzebyi TaxID=394506 RepID=A0A841Q1H0_9BACI|nr:DUF421 domain-containing protein [Salirhabdus euzebyi]MBB6451892.1 uncharacterized membrane protein YcaP (DUF421 family) [Salirhabdus euzebyi]